MLSAPGDVDQRIAGLRAGGDDYLAKPFDPDEVLLRRVATGPGSPSEAAVSWD